MNDPKGFQIFEVYVDSNYDARVRRADEAGSLFRRFFAPTASHAGDRHPSQCLRKETATGPASEYLA